MKIRNYLLQNGKLPPGNQKQDHSLNATPKFTNIWDVIPENAHPRARELLAGQSILWNYGDEDSPLGTDTGADTFGAYLSFRARRPIGGVQDFIREQLALMGIPDADWDILDAVHLEQLLKTDRKFTLLIRDEFIMGLAFAQLVLEGTVDPSVRQRALIALERQATDVLLSFRGGGEESRRKGKLAGFRRILEAA
jgi:uncharacterized protein YfeS